jgi:phospholipid/cholesterol/gamma-HCH transport system substrate-binding protein
MPRRKRATETVVGLFVLATLGLLFAVVALIGGRQKIFEERYEITGIFESVGGLQTGAEVHLAGISVGYVRAVGFSPSNKVEVVMSISREQMNRIRGDSVASIRTAGLMGDRYVEITVGSDGKPVINSGGTIKTSEPFELNEVIEQVRPTLGNIENAARNISILTDQLADPSGKVPTILENIKVLTTDAREGKGTFGALLTRDDIYVKTNSVLDTVQETADNLKVVSEDARNASARLPGMMDGAEAAIDGFTEFSTQATEAAKGIGEIVDSGKEVMDDAKAAAANLRAASEEVKEVAPKVGRVLDSAEEGVGEARKVIDAAKRSWLIRGSFEPGKPGEPIALSGRDIAVPEVSE